VKEFKDKAGVIIIPGKYIVHAKRDGDRSALEFGKVLALGPNSVRVQTVEDYWDGRVTLRAAGYVSRLDCVLCISAEMVPDKYYKLLEKL
jgi:hypothetical protein